MSAAWSIHQRGAPSPRAYLRLVARWIARVRKAIEPLHADAITDDEQRQLELFRMALRQPGVIPPPPDPKVIAAANAAAARQAARNARQGLLFAGMGRVYLEDRLRIPWKEGSLIGVDIAATDQDLATLTDWSRRGTELIRTVGQDLVAGIEDEIVQVAHLGTSTKGLAEIIQGRLGVAERHALFIARDQISKLNGAITESTQVAAGVTSYRWRSSRDQRTRKMHSDLDGTIHRWDDPPVTNPEGDQNHPGGDYQCRCVAIPVVDV